ncbi:MAG: inovirus-type Gp2 protein [Pseudomonadota bacterium]|uniref:YagK/YfjJ domain-containing protein n=1 Tax=Burkholderiaceae TaxID=119060 RepID=UPI001485BEFF|nr:inovirus-type Gp2 protein [Burkholderia sp. 4M9327F10]
MDAVSEESAGDRNHAATEEWLLDYTINSMKKNDKRGFSDSESTRAEDAASITKCVWEIINSDDRLFSVRRRQGVAFGSPRQVKLVATPLGDAFLNCLAIDLEYLSMVESIDRANPFIGLFKRTVARDAAIDADAGPCLRPMRYVLSFWSTIRRGLSDEELWKFADGLNEAIEAIREEGRAKPFRDEWRRHTRPAAKNYDSLVKMIRTLFRRHHRLLVIRVDFGYEKSHQSIPYSEVRKHRNALVDYLRQMKRLKRRVFKAYVLKLEHGLQKKWHFHALLFLDGNEVQRGVHHAMMFGEHWKDVITKGKGVYYNCNAKRVKYKKALGIGKIESHELELRRALETNVAGYIVKPDFYGQMMKDKGDHLFFRSEPRETVAKKRGPKRTKADASAELINLPLPFKPKVHARASTKEGHRKHQKPEPMQWCDPWELFARA